MSIQLSCSSCQSRFKAKDRPAGSNAKCPKCGEGVLVPVADHALVDAPPATGAEPSTARNDRSGVSSRWGSFFRYYLPAVALAALPLVFWITMAVLSYVSTSLQVLVWLGYLAVGLVRLVFEGGVPLPRVQIFDETYYEPVYDRDAFGQEYVVSHRAVDGRVNLEKATANTALDWACRLSVVFFWGGLDLVLQSAFLVFASLTFRRTGEVMEVRYANWTRAGGWIVLPVAVMITLGAFYLIQSVSRTPPVLQRETKANLVDAVAAGRTYHGTWQSHPEAGTLGLRIVSLAEADRHQGRDFEAVLFDVAQPEVTRPFKGQVLFLESAGEYPVILTPDGSFQQVPPAPDLSIYVGKERGAELLLKLESDGSLIAFGDVSLVFRAVDATQE